MGKLPILHNPTVDYSLLICSSPASTCTLDKPSVKENGMMRAVLDDATRYRAESTYPAYYEFIAEPDPEAQGTASFN